MPRQTLSKTLVTCQRLALFVSLFTKQRYQTPGQWLKKESLGRVQRSILQPWSTKRPSRASQNLTEFRKLLVVLLRSKIVIGTNRLGAFRPLPNRQAAPKANMTRDVILLGSRKSPIAAFNFKYRSKGKRFTHYSPLLPNQELLETFAMFKDVV